MQPFYFLIQFFLCFKHVLGKSHCVGTCYSGRLFPEPQDTFHGKHLKGYSYNNITTDDPAKCYSSCFQDCRCKACQMKDARCELLDEDKTSKSGDFVPQSGYVYFDLRQTMFHVESHMVPVAQGVCYNGCCRSNPCINGAKCIELCKDPKVKFKCQCPNSRTGKVCQKTISSCKDVLASSNSLPVNGVYSITRKDTRAVVQVYCAFTAPNQAWTLIESFSLDMNRMSLSMAYYNKAFNQDWARNQHSHNWKDFRMSLADMKYFRSDSSMFRATCDFPNKDIDLTPDYMIGNLSAYDPIGNPDATGKCFLITYVNIRGYEFLNVQTPMWSVVNTFHPHVACGDPTLCAAPSFPVKESVASEDCFGFYGASNTKSKCTATKESTTQWWLGDTV
ncbi:uncharacterized protein LOC110237396 [Exaiptasia diaphana]|uniref:Apple domain-containing protein n=1 Tax=Exaiptasia diaphana TaxID=2652724 RepID=A0A913X417_EXADI|nr:uncharacterized protein LOC110237396 [Exaiptasia diaphana]KXJ15374.1 hypothetical protein AC249_AIPGENE11119 [Exaiptasia diaphana]